MQKVANKTHRILAGRPGVYGCMETVARGNWNHGRCERAANSDLDAEGKPTRCTIHSTEGTARRQAKQEERWAEQRKLRESYWAREAAKAEAFKAIEDLLLESITFNLPKAWCDRLEAIVMKGRGISKEEVN